jgi:hypothetical protein
MRNGTLVPDRRRNRFPRNGGPRPTRDEIDRAHDGLHAARRALAETDAHLPMDTPATKSQLSTDARNRAERGIARARESLNRETTS